MADLPPGVIPVSADEFDRLYPIYQASSMPGQTFQQWLKATRQQPHRKRMRVVRASHMEPR